MTYMPNPQVRAIGENIVLVGVKDVVRPRVKFNDDTNTTNEPPIPFIRVEEQRLRTLSEAIWRYKEWEEQHILGKTHPGGFIFGADATEAFTHRGSIGAGTTKR